MIYWLILLVIIAYNFKLKKNPVTYLWIGFFLFITGVIVSEFEMLNLSEISFRVCLIFLLAGFVFLIKDY